MNRAQTWWYGLSPREHVLLGALGIVLAFLLGWLAIVLPVVTYRDDAIAAHAEAITARAEIAALVRQAGAVDGVPSSAATAALRAAGLEPVISGGADGAILTVPAARADVLFQALADIERRSGVAVRVAEIRTNADNTVSASLELGS